MKKLFTLFALLLGVVGQTWGTEYVLSGSTRTDYTTTTAPVYTSNGVAITVSSTRSYDKYSGSGLTDYIKTSNVSHTVDLSNIPETEKVVSVSFKGFKNSNDNTSYISNFNGTAYTEAAGTNQFLSRALVSSTDDEDIKTFTVSGLSIVGGSGANFTFSPSAETDLIITITTEARAVTTFAGSYPFTWDFTDYWGVTASELNENRFWTNDGEPDGVVHNKANFSAAEIQYGASGSEQYVSIAKGLKFTTVNANRLKLCPGSYIQVQNGGSGNSFSLVVPNVPAGMLITIETTGTDNGFTSVDNATGSKVDGVYKYVATATGDVTFNLSAQSNYGVMQITKISVTKNELNEFRLEGNQGYTHTGLEKATSVYTWPYQNITTKGFNIKINYSDAKTGAIGSGATTSDFSIESDNSDVINVSGVSYSSSRADRISFNGLSYGKPGTANVTFKFKGSDIFNSREFTQTFTITKLQQVITFAESSKTIDYVANGTATNAASISNVKQVFADGYEVEMDLSTYPGTAITYTSSNTNVATVNETTGEITMVNSGTTTITATAAGDDYYETGSVSYILTVNGTSTPTITMTDQATSSTVADGGELNTTFGNTVTVTGASSVGGTTVKYRSGDTSIAKVDENGKVTLEDGGDVVIYVYTEGVGAVNPAEVSYTLHIAPTTFTLKFLPNEGYVNVGKTITPAMSLPSLNMNSITSITATSENTSIATVPENLLEKDGGSYKYLIYNGVNNIIQRFLPIITGVAVGETQIKVKFTSKNYISTEAVYTVHVTADGTKNFSWADGENPSYTIYTGDFLMLPGFTGNTNGNDSYSKGENKKYLYQIKKGKAENNNKDYKRFEGVPDIAIVDGGTTTTNSSHAAVFWAQGQGGTFADTLMIYGKAAGRVTLRAIDPQNSSLYCDATLTIVNKSELQADSTSYVGSTMTFPYTWDFCHDMDMTDIVKNNHYWVEYNDHYAAGNAYFNLDYADENNNNATNDRFYKHFAAGTMGTYMPQFYGLKVKIQGSSYYSTKIDRLQIKKYDSSRPNDARLVVNGGTMQFLLPHPSTQPSSYRIYMKVKPSSKCKINVGSKTYGTDETAGGGTKLTVGTDAYLYFDVSSTAAYSSAQEGTVLNMDNVQVYWIATSTEARTIPVSYQCATYAYTKDIDMVKTEEAMGVKAYTGKSFSTATNKLAMQQVTDKFAANEGVVVIPNSTLSNDFPAYFIAKAENTNSPEVVSAVSGNLLTGVATAKTVQNQFIEDGTTYINLGLSNQYKVVDANGKTKSLNEDGTGKSYVSGAVSFYRLSKTGTIPAQRSYLTLPLADYTLAQSVAYDASVSASVKSIGMIFEDIDNGEATGIRETGVAPHSDGYYYNLNGVRVENPTKGIYIRNGKKVIVK